MMSSEGGGRSAFFINAARVTLGEGGAETVFASSLVPSQLSQKER